MCLTIKKTFAVFLVVIIMRLCTDIYSAGDPLLNIFVFLLLLILITLKYSDVRTNITITVLFFFINPMPICLRTNRIRDDV